MLSFYFVWRCRIGDNLFPYLVFVLTGQFVTVSSASLLDHWNNSRSDSEVDLCNSLKVFWLIIEIRIALCDKCLRVLLLLLLWRVWRRRRCWVVIFTGRKDASRQAGYLNVALYSLCQLRRGVSGTFIWSTFSLPKLPTTFEAHRMIQTGWWRLVKQPTNLRGDNTKNLT